MSESKKATPLYLHTLETLCEELVSGRPVLLDDKGREFRLTSPEARLIFDWYRNNRAKWAGKVMKQDVEAIADQLGKKPPELPETLYDDQSPRLPRIHLKSVRAHRFAGIHRYGQPQQPPADFYFELEKPLTLVEGMNGAGKTSLLSAITWCLTGHVYRSQRPPESVAQSVQLEIVGESDSGAGDETTFDMTAITPMPPAEILTSLGGEPLLLDTWVELAFVDDDGNEVGSVKRSVARSPRGKILINEPDFSGLGLDPIAREIGTKMPGLIPYIQLGVASDLGKAVAGLTGIKPLQDLAQHARKSCAKLKKDLVNDRNADIRKIDSDFLEAQRKLANEIRDHPEIDPKKPLPDPGPEKTVEKQLAKLRQHFEALQSQTLAEAKSILGESFDHEDRSVRKDLMDNVGPALGMLDVANLGRLPSANRLSKLAGLSSEELTQAEEVIQKLIAEAKDIARLEEQPDVAARLRLYAKVANWIKDVPEHFYHLENCPICQSAIDGKADAVTGIAIIEHIRKYLEIDSSYLEKSLKAWEDDAMAILAKSLPDSLRAEMREDLPKTPTDLISSALGEELFEPQCYSGCLMSLKSLAQTLCKKELESLQPFLEPEKIVLPEYLEKNKGGLAQAIWRVTRAVAFARWRHNNKRECRQAFSRIVGTAKPSDDSVKKPRSPVVGWPLSECLVALDRMVKGTAPLTAALSNIKGMTEKLAARREKEDRLALYSRTAVAIEELLGLDDLVELQVAFLINKLLLATLKWRDAFYVPAFADAPEVISTDVGTDGSLAIDAASEGTKASARHISNASDLRATLLSFLVAFWQHLLEIRGGLSLLLLDDLQELFDRENRRRVANTIPSILENGGRVLVTTNDTGFGRRVTGSTAERIGSNKVDRRRIHPLNASRQHIELGQFQEAIDAKRRAFEHRDNWNEAQPARDYVKDLRIYLENRLIDFLDIADSGLSGNPTFSDLMSGVRGRIRRGHDAFSTQAFANLISDPALANNSDFIKLMNLSHHGNEDEITFNDVWQVREDCIRVRKLIDSAHEEYERWLRRDPREPILSMPAPPEPMQQPSFDVPVIMDLAAFTTETPVSEVTEAGERFSGSWFENRALYVINTHNFGFAAPRNCRAIVDLSDRPIIDKMLVIAIHQDKVYARRHFRDDSRPNVVVLASEAENPLKRAPTVLLPSEEVLLLSVVGILFDDRPYFPRPTGEAELVNDFDLFENVELVFSVRGESAIPLALPGQTILGGGFVMTSQFDEFEGSPVAIATSEGSAFKKIGKVVPGAPHVRQFESIGGLGESMLVRTEDIEDSFTALPLLQSIRRVLGVLYETN